MSVSHFISDLHLEPGRPDITARFFALLDRLRGDSEALYILGDLFEAWIGDDDAEPLHAEVASRLREFSGAGARIYFLHGNRDFLLADDYARRAALTLLPDPSVVDLYGTPTLLMHGDSLCTQDLAYQRFRAVARRPWVQHAFRALPLTLRKAVARHLRKASAHSKEHKPLAIMDVAPEAVAQALRSAGCTRLIHGHTHRPARHDAEVDGRACERWVLPDWDARGGWLSCSADGCELHFLQA